MQTVEEFLLPTLQLVRERSFFSLTVAPEAREAHGGAEFAGLPCWIDTAACHASRFGARTL